MVDVWGLPVATTSLAASDFVFETSDGTGPTNWSAAPAPSSITVRRSPIPEQPARVTVAWPDGAVRDCWLRVTVKATAYTGLASPDVFSFGSLVGETGDRAALVVNGLDLAAVRRHFFQTSPITGRFDFDRDGKVAASDLSLARANASQSLPSPAIAVAPPATVAFSERLTTPRLADEVLK
jgi:hypothetical protein